MGNIQCVSTKVLEGASHVDFTPIGPHCGRRCSRCRRADRSDAVRRRTSGAGRSRTHSSHQLRDFRAGRARYRSRTWRRRLGPRRRRPRRLGPRRRRPRYQFSNPELGPRPRRPRWRMARPRRRIWPRRRLGRPRWLWPRWLGPSRLHAVVVSHHRARAGAAWGLRAIPRLVAPSRGGDRVDLTSVRSTRSLFTGPGAVPAAVRR
jgi:hypothetical protein